MVKDSTVSLRLPGELRVELERIAAADERSMSSVMVRALREYVERLKRHPSKTKK